MDNRERLIQQYGNHVRIGEKKIGEMINYLREKGIIFEIPLEDMNPSILGCFIYNIRHSWRFISLGFPDDNLESDPVPYIKHPERFMESDAFNVVGYQFSKCINNDSFYKNYVPDEATGDTIYIMLETKSKVIACNCGKLFLELAIFRGVSEYDIENKTVAFYEHLSNLDFFENGEY